MSHKRKLELLAYAKVCFDKCTSPFALVHLQKNNVSSDECIDLSLYIADLLYLELDQQGVLEAKELLEEAEKKFMETQE